MEPDNPYTYLEGYKLYDADGEEIGEIEQSVYDAPADVLKYLVLDGHPIPADSIEIDAEQERVRVPYGKETVETAPELREFSGEFDRALREHYEERG
ncbi:MAG: PRC-barrel domain-containing protein [Rubrobacteraceae bacterium]